MRRLSIREDSDVTIIANEVKNFGENKQKILLVDITDSTEEEKKKLRGAIKYFVGDRNNINIEVKVGEDIRP